MKYIYAICSLTVFTLLAVADTSASPAPWVYDPVIGSSTASNAVKQLDENRVVPPVKGSFTFEVYVKASTIPNHNQQILRRVAGENDEEVAAGLRWLNNFRQCYWAGMYRESRKAKPVRFSAGHYTTVARLWKETNDWRHLAIVYKESDLSISIWVDHWLTDTHRIEKALASKDVRFFVDSEFEGQVHSVRLSNDVLGPESFLRATATELQNVSFDHEENVFPADAGHLSVKRNFGAVGDGVTDDTAAIQRAFYHTAAKHASGKGSCVLYFPAGTYLVSDTVKWSRFLRVQGENRDNTIIRLADNCEGFADPDAPKPVVSASAVKGPPGSNKAVNGSTIANWFHDFTVDTGSGNPGAVGVEYHSNNYGSLEDVTIKSGDGAGVTGLDLSHKTNGPTLIANTLIEGFDTGILTKYMEYSITMENVDLRNQNVVGIKNGGNILALRNIHSSNTVPAIESSGGLGMVTLLDSNLTGGNDNNAAIVTGGALFAKNVKIDGYGTSIDKQINTWNPHKKPNFQTVDGEDVIGDIDLYISDKTVHPEDKQALPLNLPVKEAPEIPLGDLKSDWVNVTDFAEKVTGTGKDADWSTAIEAAFATGKPSIYFPRGGYSVNRPVSVPATVKRIYGMDNGLQKQGLADKKNPDYANRPPTLIIEKNTDDPLLINYFSVSVVEHRSSRPVLLQHARFVYRGNPNAGDVYIRDCITPWSSFGEGQNVWARQWNVESHAVDSPCVLLNGANLWSLGFKTEYESQKLRAINNSRVEIYGSFIYPVVKGIPKDRPVFEIIDSEFSAQWGLSIYTAGHFLQVKDTKKGKTTETTIRDGIQLGPRFRFDFYSNK